METLALILGGLALVVYARVEYIRRYIARRQDAKRRGAEQMRPYPVLTFGRLPFVMSKEHQEDAEAGLGFDALKKRREPNARD